MEQVLLLVDDDPNILSSLSRLLRSEGYQILTAENANEATALMAQHPVGVVLCDQNMPDTTGTDFLSIVKQTTPNAVRIILTGRDDSAFIMDAINRGAVYKFLQKPWDDNSLKATIADAFVYYELTLKRQRLTREISNAYDYLAEINFTLEDKLARTSQQLEHTENYDEHTGLPNRALFTEKLNGAVKGASSGDYNVAVIGIDVDRFKLVNDSYGHAVGDALLSAIAQRMRQSLGERYILARVSGDEFAVLVDNVDGHHDVAQHVNTVRTCFDAPFHIHDHEIVLCTSIGVGVYPYDGDSAHRLLRNVVTATHHASAQGGNQCQYFATEMNDRVTERVSLEVELFHALKREEFVVHYQPQINIASGEIVGFEALLRWQHPTRGLIPPLQFIPILEEIGLINDVGHWLLRHVLRQKQQWQEYGVDSMRLAINLSVRQLCEASFPDSVQDALDETGFDPRQSALEFEVTESMVIQQLDTVLCALAELNDMGIRVAVDDFGTGYASLSYLTRLPVQSVKIDRSFIQRMSERESDRTLAAAIIAMAQSIGLSVVAEGVETEEQFEMLKGFGCDEMQGFLYSKPLSADKVTALLENYQNNRRQAG